MEFNCPACDAPHAFPEDQIPETGIVVACTRCGIHITLDRNGVRGDDNTAAMQMAEQPAPPSPEPPTSSGVGGSLSGGPTLGSGSPSIPPGGGNPSIPPDSGAPSVPAGGGRPSIPPSGPAPASSPGVGAGWPQPGGSGGWPQPGGPQPAPGPQPAAGAAPDPQPAAAEEPGFGAGVASAFGSAVDAASKAIGDAAEEQMAAETDVPEGLAFPGFQPGEGGGWTWKDLPRAFVGLLDVRRVVFTVVGLWGAIVAFGLVKWLGGWLGSKVSILGTVLDVVAWAALIVGFALVTATMSFVCHQTVIERRPSSIKSGVAWVQEWIKSVAGTPLAFAAVIAAAVLVEAVLGLVGRIPFVGPIVWGITTPVTAALTLGSGLVAVALVYSLPLYVPVIYNDKTGPAETLKRLLSLFRAHGLSLVGYLLLSGLMITIAMAVTVLPALVLGRMFTDGVVPEAMGENLMGVFFEAPAVFRGAIATVVTPGGMPGETGFGHTLGGIFAGVGSSILPAIVMGLFVLVQYTAGCIIHAIITGRQKV